MPASYLVIVIVHILAAFVWLGGMLFLGVVGAPVLRRVEPAALRQRLFREIGLRFRGAAWSAIAVLLVSGVALLHLRGWLRLDGVLTDPAFWRTGAGRVLAGKLLAVAAMVTLAALHDFAIGPAAGREPLDSARALVLRRRAARLARANAVLAVIVIVLAARLARGG